MSEDPQYGTPQIDHSHDPRDCSECAEGAQRELAKAPHDRQQVKAPRDRALRHPRRDR